MMDNQILSVWKDPGMTSYDVVNLIKKKTNASKVGHCGTLDPFANGVLLICTGDETKNINNFMNLEKEYVADITFGCETDTLDKTGAIINQKENFSNLQISEDIIRNILDDFIGSTKQIPPYFSALKFKGIPLYKYARKGIFIRKKARTVFIDSLKLLDMKKNKIKIYVKCNKGTYIRALARDIAYKLDTYGYLSDLSRISLGPYNKDNSIRIDEI
jgi:tRNA pseudouridine55 synthase